MGGSSGVLDGWLGSREHIGKVRRVDRNWM